MATEILLLLLEHHLAILMDQAMASAPSEAYPHANGDDDEAMA
jgi:hypothetical protein